MIWITINQTTNWEIGKVQVYAHLKKMHSWIERLSRITQANLKLNSYTYNNTKRLNTPTIQIRVLSPQRNNLNSHHAFCNIRERGSRKNLGNNLNRKINKHQIGPSLSLDTDPEETGCSRKSSRLVFREPLSLFRTNFFRLSPFRRVYHFYFRQSWFTDDPPMDLGVINPAMTLDRCEGGKVGFRDSII